MFGDEAGEEVDSEGNVARFVAFQVGDELLHPRHEVVARQHFVETIVACFGHDPLDNHVIGGGGTYLRLYRGVGA